jgi:hypothetical protein
VKGSFAVTLLTTFLTRAHIVRQVHPVASYPQSFL